jgi:hypothetical protein
MTLDDLILAFGERYDVLFRRATPTDIAAGAEAGVPRPVLDFFFVHEPKDPGNGAVRLFTVSQLVAGLTTGPARAGLASLGYYPLAGTPGNDLYCVRPVPGQKLDPLPVRLFGHAADYTNASADTVAGLGLLVAPNLEIFFQKALNGSIASSPART